MHRTPNWFHSRACPGSPSTTRGSWTTTAVASEADLAPPPLLPGPTGEPPQENQKQRGGGEEDPPARALDDRPGDRAERRQRAEAGGARRDPRPETGGRSRGDRDPHQVRDEDPEERERDADRERAFAEEQEKGQREHRQDRGERDEQGLVRLPVSVHLLVPPGERLRWFRHGHRADLVRLRCRVMEMGAELAENVLTHPRIHPRQPARHAPEVLLDAAHRPLLRIRSTLVAISPHTRVASARADRPRSVSV